MKRSILLILIILVTVTASFAQRIAPYKVTAIKILPFDEPTGKFEDEAKGNERGFFNDLDTSVLAVVEITGTPGKFASKRDLSVRVTQGRKVMISRIAQVGIPGDDGKYFVPIWINSPICDPVTITATVTGQTTRATMTRKLDAHCGE